MKTKSKLLHAVGLTGLLTTVSYASIDIEAVFVGDVDNPPADHSNSFRSGVGPVSYGYYIGTYEVTNAQYTAFLNSVATSDTRGLYNTEMAESSHGGILRSGNSGSYTYSTILGRENNPVNFVSFKNAMRFANWLTTGDTEKGVYDLSALATTIDFWRDDTYWANGGVAIASQNEWFKAAYYSGSPTGADGDGYWLYPTQSNSISSADANYGGSVGTLTPVGYYGHAASYYGTFDQAGNVFEWTEATMAMVNRVSRGGAFNYWEGSLPSTFFYDVLGGRAEPHIGFRVTSLHPIPEPSTYAAIVGVLGLLVVAWRRRGRDYLSSSMSS